MIFSMPFFIILLDNYLEHFNYNEVICNITDITYPDSFPTQNTSYLWSECDCGKYCTSLYPCISLYTDFNDEPIKRSFLEKDDFSSCTFSSNQCADGENPLEIANYVTQSINTANQYLNNSEITCYIHKDDPENKPIFLENNNKLVDFILSAIFFGLGIIISCVSGYKIINDKEVVSKKTINNKNEIEIDISTLP